MASSTLVPGALDVARSSSSAAQTVGSLSPLSHSGPPLVPILQCLEAPFMFLGLDHPPTAFQNGSNHLAFGRSELPTPNGLYHRIHSGSNLCRRCRRSHFESHGLFFARRQQTLHAQTHGRGIALQGHECALLGDSFPMAVEHFLQGDGRLVPASLRPTATECIACLV
jgi:hypothetical protein